jgi:hypothetical protein
LAVSKSLEHNRSLKMMMSIEKVVKWRDVEALLMEHYETGTSNEGADAYPALMLLKALLLQKWFRLRPVGHTPRRGRGIGLDSEERDTALRVQGACVG